MATRKVIAARKRARELLARKLCREAGYDPDREQPYYPRWSSHQKTRRYWEIFGPQARRALIEIDWNVPGCSE